MFFFQKSKFSTQKVRIILNPKILFTQIIKIGEESNQ